MVAIRGSKKVSGWNSPCRIRFRLAAKALVVVSLAGLALFWRQTFHALQVIGDDTQWTGTSGEEVSDGRPHLVADVASGRAGTSRSKLDGRTHGASNLGGDVANERAGTSSLETDGRTYGMTNLGADVANWMGCAWPRTDVVDSVRRCREPEDGGASSSRRAIPRVIWQTVPSHDAPHAFALAARTWTEKNPTWDRFVLDDGDLDRFVATFYNASEVDMFRRLPLGVMRADMFRYMIIHQFGGLYADADTICINPIEEWIPDDCQVVIMNENHRQWCQWTFAARPHHPLMGAVVSTLFERMKTGVRVVNINAYVQTITGPFVWTDVINSYFNLTNENNFREFVKSDRAKSMRKDGVCWLDRKKEKAMFRNQYASDRHQFHKKGYKSWHGRFAELAERFDQIGAALPFSIQK